MTVYHSLRNAQSNKETLSGNETYILHQKNKKSKMKIHIPRSLVIKYSFCLRSYIMQTIIKETINNFLYGINSQKTRATYELNVGYGLLFANQTRLILFIV